LKRKKFAGEILDLYLLLLYRMVGN